MKPQFVNLLILIALFGFVFWWGSPILRDKLVYLNYEDISDYDIEENEIEFPSINKHITSLLNKSSVYDYNYFNYAYGLLIPENLKDECKDFKTLNGYFLNCQLNLESLREYNAMSKFVKENKAEYFDYATYLYFLEEKYLSSITDLVSNDNIWQARKLVGHSYIRMSLLDAPPLNHLEVGDRMIIDKILFYNVLFNQPELLLDKDKMLVLVKLVDSNFKNEEIFNSIFKEGVKEKIPIDIYNYLVGLKYFYQHKFKESHDVFNTISSSTFNAPLKNLSLLMQARTLFWSQKFSGTAWLESEETKSKINEISEILNQRTLKTDIQFYLDSLNVQTTEIPLKIDTNGKID